MDSNSIQQSYDDDLSHGEELPPGTPLLLGQYVIEKFLNSGGFGITYLAKDSLDRTVVIKECFPTAFCGRKNGLVGSRNRAHIQLYKTIVSQFIEEARKLARLSHPNIVGVHQVFEDNNTAYMALDFVEGPDLLEVIDSDQKIEPKALEVMTVKLLDAIGFVHSEGILHRDVSPDNILIRPNGDPVLIDFGAARETASRATRFIGGMQTVKDGYSPQEFYLSKGKQYPSSDLYSLAATLYHAITGAPPPTGQDRLTAIASGEDDPKVPITHLASGYSKAYLEAIDVALNVLPNKRMETAAAWRSSITKPDVQPLTRGTVSRPVLAVDNSRADDILEPRGGETLKPAPKTVGPEAQDKDAARTSAKKKSKSAALVGSVAALAIAAGIGGYVIYSGELGEPSGAAGDTVAAKAPQADPTTSLAAPAAPTQAQPNIDVASAPPEDNRPPVIATPVAPQPPETSTNVVPSVLEPTELPAIEASVAPQLAEPTAEIAPAAPEQPPAIADAAPIASERPAPRPVAGPSTGVPIEAQSESVASAVPGTNEPAEVVGETTRTTDVSAETVAANLPPEVGPVEPEAVTVPQMTFVNPTVPKDYAPVAEFTFSIEPGSDLRIASTAPDVPPISATKPGTLPQIGAADMAPSVPESPVAVQAYLAVLQPGTSLPEPAELRSSSVSSVVGNAPMRFIVPLHTGAIAGAVPTLDVQPPAPPAPKEPDPLEVAGLKTTLKINYPFVVDGANPTVILAARNGAPAWLESGLHIVSANGIPVESLDDVSKIVESMSDLSGNAGIAVTLAVRDPANGAVAIRTLDLSATRETVLANGDRFETRLVDGAWLTTFRTDTTRSNDQLTNGDVVLASMPDNAPISDGAALIDVLASAVESGTDTLGFVVQRDGSMWFATLNYDPQNAN